MRNWHYKYPKLETHNRMWKGEDKRDAEQGIVQAGKGVEAATKMTPEEEAQYKASFGTGNQLNAILQYLAGTGQIPSGYVSPEQQYTRQGPLAQATYNQVLQGAQSPYQNYISSLQPSLQLVENSINQQAAGRGLLQSGIPIGDMGTAGATLAVQDAQARMNAYQQSISNASTLQGQITGESQQNLANLGNLYQFQQQAGQGAMNRQGQGAANAAQYYAYPGQAALGNAYGSQGQEGSMIGGGLGSLFGVGAGLALAPMTGGASLLPSIAAMTAGAGIGGMAGSQLGGGVQSMFNRPKYSY